MPFFLRIPALALLFSVLTAAIGCGGVSMGAQSSASQQKAPAIKFGAQPITVASGATTVLSWNTSNASSVTISGVGAFAANGSVKVAPTVTTTYTATAIGPGGKTVSSTVVNVTGSNQNPPPTISLSAQPSDI